MKIGAAPASPLRVLIPNNHGMKYILDHPLLVGVPYDPIQRPTEAQRSAPVIVVDMTDVDITRRFIDGLNDLRLIQTLSAGVEHWDGQVPPGIALANASGAHGAGVAEWVVAILLNHYRQLPGFAADQAARRWVWHPTSTLIGKRVAILGAGDLGRSTKRVLEAFDCPVTLYGRTARENIRAFADFSAHSDRYDIVVVALPDTPDTRQLADAEFLKSLRDGVVLVNIGRGTAIDTNALMAATAAGRITALLDVTDPEPLPAEHPLWTAAGVTLTPHVAGSIPDVWDRAWHTVLSNLDAWTSGDELKNVVSLRSTLEQQSREWSK